MSFRKRVLGGVAGLAAVRFIQLVGPLLQLPVLIGQWGIDVFGGWLTAGALATLCTIAALSIYPAIQANVAMSLGRGEPELAARFHFSGQAACIVGTLLLLGLVVLGYGLLESNAIYSVRGIDPATMNLLFVANAAGGIAAYNSSVMGGVGRFGLGNAVEAGRRVLELIATLALVGLAGFKPQEIAILLCISAAIGIGVSAVLLRRVSQPVLPRGRFDGRALWECRSAVLGAFCLAYAYPQLFVTGPRILIGIALGNTAVALYAVATNIVRIPRQIADVISYPFLNDMSYAFGEGRVDRVRSIFMLPSRLCFFMSLLAAIGILIAGPWLIELLSGELFDGGRVLLAVLAIASVIECTSLVALTLLLGIGRTILSSLILLVGGALAMVAAWLVADAIGLLAFAFANLIGTIAYAIALWATALPTMKLGWSGFVRMLVCPPISEMIGEARALLVRRGR